MKQKMVLGILVLVSSCDLNPFGSTRTLVEFEPKLEGPTLKIQASIKYSTSPATYKVGEKIDANVPTLVNLEGEYLFLSEQALPEGLQLDAKSGAITGIPEGRPENIDEPAYGSRQSIVITAQQIDEDGEMLISGKKASTTLNITINDRAPSDLLYQVGSVILENGREITAEQISELTPIAAAGAVILFSIEPPLPAGLQIDKTSGSLTGVPEEVLSETLYTITASNTGGSTQATLSITVNDIPPSHFFYAITPAVYQINTKVSNNYPSNEGGKIIFYSVSPALPNGLSLNTDTGIISGTPAEIFPATVFTVTGVNSGGGSTAAIGISVVPKPPTHLSYPLPAAPLIKREALTLFPTFRGGEPSFFSVIVGELPRGLALDSGTGMISGSPRNAGITTLTIEASNQSGSAQCQLTLDVKVDPPQNLTYSVVSANFEKFVSIDEITPSSDGGSVDSYSISPALPLGLVFNTDSGQITGTPLQVQSSQSYSVRASNPGGFASTTFSIGIDGSAEERLSLGERHGCSVTEGSLACWGDNSYGQLGTSQLSFSQDPVSLSITGRVQAVTSGSRHVCAIVDGAVQCWGDNSTSQLGSSTSQDFSAIPVQVTGLSTGVTDISAFDTHTCVIQNNEVKCWGDNSSLQLGSSSLSESIYPVLISGLSGATSISVGTSHSCAILEGIVKCWGSNLLSQLSQTLGSENATPQTINNIGSGVTKISSGANFTCAVTSTSIYCWGENRVGQLGNGHYSVSEAVATQVLEIDADIKSLSTGEGHACAVLVSGDGLCWGYNFYGQLGDGSAYNIKTTPVSVTESTGRTKDQRGFKTLEAGYDQTCSHRDDGVITCWGWE